MIPNLSFKTVAHFAGLEGELILSLTIEKDQKEKIQSMLYVPTFALSHNNILVYGSTVSYVRPNKIFFNITKEASK